MPFLNKLDEVELRVAERLSAWLLTLFGYFVAMSIAVDTAGWDDPVYDVARKMPYTPYSWAVMLTLFTLVFNIGYITKPGKRWRGPTIIVGAVLCATWWFGMSVTMARMVYQMPTRITDLWPVVAFFIGCMYLTRVIVYANAFTGDRWSTNPYQTWGTTFLMMASLSQVIIGIAPVSILSEIERPAALTIGAGNLFGACVTMFGLHMKDKEVGLMYELAGSFSLVATLGWYCAEVLHGNPLAGTTLGFSMPEAFVFATLHRAIQIFTLQWSRQFGKDRLERRMINALNPIAAVPPPDTTTTVAKHRG